MACHSLELIGRDEDLSNLMYGDEELGGEDQRQRLHALGDPRDVHLVRLQQHVANDLLCNASRIQPAFAVHGAAHALHAKEGDSSNALSA